MELISALITQTCTHVAARAYAALTMMNWQIGHMIHIEVLHENRADYDKQIVASLGQQLTERFGRGFKRADLYRMVKFAQAFPDPEIVVTLSRQLSWGHIKTLLPVPSAEARDFYIEQAVNARLSVRALRELSSRQGFERRGETHTFSVQLENCRIPQPHGLVADREQEFPGVIPRHVGDRVQVAVEHVRRFGGARRPHADDAVVPRRRKSRAGRVPDREPWGVEAVLEHPVGVLHHQGRQRLAGRGDPAQSGIPLQL